MSGNPFALDYKRPVPANGREALARCSGLFPVDDLEWKIQVAGQGSPPSWVQVICYVSARAAQSRLDEVFGLDWWSNYEETEKGIRCYITVVTPEGKEVTRSDVSHWETDSGKGQPKAYKATHSLAFKRAAVQFGIGRYLYALEATFVRDVVTAREARKLRHPVVLRGGKGNNKYAAGFNPMQVLPKWAIPEQGRRLPEREQPQAPEAAPQPKPKPQREPTALERQAAEKGHSVWWEAGGRKWFCQQLNGMNLKYDDVAAWREAGGNPRPSALDETGCKDLVAGLLGADTPERRGMTEWLNGKRGAA